MYISQLCLSVALAMTCSALAQAQQWQPQGAAGGKVRALAGRGFWGKIVPDASRLPA